MEKAKKIYQQILNQPEAVRRRLFTVLVALIAPLVFGLWFYSLKLHLEKSERVRQPKSFVLPAEMTAQFKQGVANMRELLGDLNLKVPQIFGSGNFRPNPRSSHPPVNLPLDNGR